MFNQKIWDKFVEGFHIGAEVYYIVYRVVAWSFENIENKKSRLNISLNAFDKCLKLIKNNNLI